MTRGVLAIMFTGVVVGLVACNIGGPRGTEDSLEADIALHRDGMLEVLTEAIGPFEVVGDEVDVHHCDPDEAYSAGVSITVRPDTADGEAARALILEWLEANGITIDASFPDSPNRPFWFTYDSFGDQIKIRTGRGVEIGSNTDCYEVDRINASDPWLLQVTTGEMLSAP